MGCLVKDQQRWPGERESRTHVESEENGFVGQRREHRLHGERQVDQGGTSTVWAPVQGSGKLQSVAEQRGWAAS